MNHRISRDVLIDISEDTSLSVAAEDFRSYHLVAIQMPSSWTAASLTFQAKEDPDGSYQDVYDDAGNELEVQAAASRYILLSSDVRESLPGGAWGLKVRSGTTGTPVAQAADRTVTLILEK